MQSGERVAWVQVSVVIREKMGKEKKEKGQNGEIVLVRQTPGLSVTETRKKSEPVA